MEQLKGSSEGSLGADENRETGLKASRAYQLEMFEASLKENLIVVMDTGSGKTHVAVLRIMHELEKSQDCKLIWFLAPTVTLCNQQYDVFRLNLPSVSIRLIIGSDNVERWKTQEIWDGLLGSHRLIVSTHAILSDALDHGFVTMKQLRLLIFDEAHHCSLHHPANHIMKEHYYPYLSRSEDKCPPSILGLTASPVMKARADLKSLRLIESNLNAVTKSPKIHIDELREFVHLPEFVRMTYRSDEQSERWSVLEMLRQKLQSMGILKSDPPIAEYLGLSPTQEAPPPKETRSQEELRRFFRRAEHVRSQLGASAGDYYALLAIDKLKEARSASKELLIGWREKEREDIWRILSSVRQSLGGPFEMENDSLEISTKFEKLTNFLCSRQTAGLTGIIFVDQRATASMLCKLLSIYWLTKHFKCANFVGTSNCAARRTSLGDLTDTALQEQHLTDFRQGKCDLIVATSVLEEGIDVSSCNLVVCFDTPQNLKSFIQRRGRARDSKSVLLMMVPEESTTTKKKSSAAKMLDWKVLEEEMIKVYQDERRHVESLTQQEDLAENGTGRYETGIDEAVLTLDNALRHLNHFCDLLPQSTFVETRPCFKILADPRTELKRAEVILPNCLDASLRRSIGCQEWRSEREAKKDAAFEAYVRLHQAGLVDDHLLPNPRLLPDQEILVEDVPSTVQTVPCLNPWKQHAIAWDESLDRNARAYEITIRRPMESSIFMFLILPKQLPSIPELELFWEANMTYSVSFETVTSESIQFEQDVIGLARKINLGLLQSTHSSKVRSNREDFAVFFAPFLDSARLEEWIAENLGRLEAHEVDVDFKISPYRIVRHIEGPGWPVLFQAWVDSGNALEVVQLPNKQNFLQPRGLNENAVRKEKTYDIPCDEATFDKLCPEAVEFGLLMPSILHHMERVLVASELCSTVLKKVKISDINLILEALTASSTSERLDYQRLELIGDTTLKFIVATQLFAKKKSWHEGYLSKARDRIVANSRLARAAIDKDLAQFIITAHFSPRGWRPAYVSDLLLEGPISEREMSAKVLADVVEALIGVAQVDGGLPCAAVCANVFLDEITPESIEDTLRPYLEELTELSNQSSHHDLHRVERLLSYRFRNKSYLFSSMTHPSLITDLVTPSYQRLEFLGDAVLDMVIVRKLAAYTEPPLSNDQMHLIKSALVNAEFLAFLCMEFANAEEVIDVQEIKNEHYPNRPEVRTLRKTRRVALCDFMRFLGAEVAIVRKACVERYERLADSIRQAMHHGECYPWPILMQLNAPKFLSDILEAVFGAIFVDSCGDLDACEMLAERMGMISYLRRIVDEQIDVLHPKNKLGKMIVMTRRKKEDGEDPNPTVKYTLRQEETEKQQYRGFVSVGDVDFAEVRNGLSREEVEARAADIAVQALLGKGDNKYTVVVCQ